MKCDFVLNIVTYFVSSRLSWPLPNHSMSLEDTESMTSVLHHEHETPEHPSVSFIGKEASTSHKRKRLECSVENRVVIDEDQSLLVSAFLSSESLDAPVASKTNGDLSIIVEELTCTEDTAFDEKCDKENITDLQNCFEARIAKRQKVRISLWLAFGSSSLSTAVSRRGFNPCSVLHA